MATSLAAAIQKRTGIDAKLVEGAGGIFDVFVDGKLVFSKQKTGRFPEHDEVLKQMA